MSDSIDRVFVKAISTIKALSARKGPGSLPQPPVESRIKLYGLYKQATEGDVEGIMPRPTGKTPEDAANRRKWDAWKDEEDVSKTEAKRRYISFLIETMHTYASDSQEARELVADLEYLWDQIKDLQPTSSDDSATGGVGSSVLSQSRHKHFKHRQHISSDRDMASQAGSIVEESTHTALTSSNLRSYNEHQQHHTPPYAPSYSSTGQRIDPGSNNANKNSQRKGGLSYHPLPESTLGIPPSSLSGMYRAQSYMSGRSAASVTHRNETGKSKHRSDNNNAGRPSKNTSAQRVQPSFNPDRSRRITEDNSRFTAGLGRDDEFYDARAVESSSEDILHMQEENIEMRKWRRDVNWALETINEEILAIRQRYGVSPLHQHPSSGTHTQDPQQPHQNRPDGNGKSRRGRSKQRKDSSTTATDESEFYRNSILYTSLVNLRRILSKLGIVSDIGGGAIDPSSSTSSDDTSFFSSSTGSVARPSNKPRAWLIFRVLRILFGALRRVLVDVIFIHLLVYFVVKYIHKHPESAHGDGFFSKMIKTWDDSVRKLVIADLVTGNIYNNDIGSAGIITKIRSFRSE